MKLPSDDPNKLRWSQQQVENVVNDVMKGHNGASKLSFREELVEKANLVTKQVHDAFVRMHDIQATPMTKREAIDHICNLYKEHYKDWPKDDLLENLALVQACYHAESINSKLI